MSGTQKRHRWEVSVSPEVMGDPAANDNHGCPAPCQTGSPDAGVQVLKAGIFDSA